MENNRIVIESKDPVQYSREDGGASLIFSVIGKEKMTSPFYVDLRSYEPVDTRRETPRHTKAMKFAGKRVRVTIEELS